MQEADWMLPAFNGSTPVANFQAGADIPQNQVQNLYGIMKTSFMMRWPNNSSKYVIISLLRFFFKNHLVYTNLILWLAYKMIESRLI